MLVLSYVNISQKVIVHEQYSAETLDHRYDDTGHHLATVTGRWASTQALLDPFDVSVSHC